ncbi:MAG: PAS domain S-box protein [Arcobacter sp.]|nr:PAS domain S-box protein [Arcobacter sp.]
MIQENEKKFLDLICKVPNVAVQGYDKNRRVIYWNKASQEIYGYTKEDAMGNRVEDLIIPDFMIEEVIQNIKDCHEKKIDIPSGELKLKHKNGSTVYVSSSHVMLYNDTSSPELFCIDIDINEQKKQEKELKEKNLILQEKSKMADIGKMIENISHQWKQPLQMVSSAVCGIKLVNDLNKLDKKYLISSLDTVEKNIQYMSNTIDLFGNYYKKNESKTEYNISTIIKMSLELIKSYTRKYKINVIINVEEKIIHRGYQNHLIQVLINIITNSIEAFKNRDIKEKYIFLSTIKKKNEIQLILKDNANGIDENIIDNVFEEKFTTKKDKNTRGIGLFLSKKLIKDSMSGDISVKNSTFTYSKKSYKGAEFIIKLPYEH